MIIALRIWTQHSRVPTKLRPDLSSSNNTNRNTCITEHSEARALSKFSFYQVSISARIIEGKGGLSSNIQYLHDIEGVFIWLVNNLLFLRQRLLSTSCGVECKLHLG
jgi:hypothetical protein